MDHAPANITPFFWLILIAFVVSLITRRVRAPYALTLVITGLAVGIPHLLPQAHLDPQTLFTVFLPPLLFESALHLRVTPLRQEWRSIALFALAGTVLAAFITGGLIAWALHLPLPVALVFGALISATDPISVIAVFKRLGAPRRLVLLMETESLFNDGVAVVLFRVLLAGALGAGSISFGQSLGQFLLVMGGGAALGAAVGALASRATRHFDDHLLEITLTTVVAFGSYLAAESLHVSGVVAVVAAGMVVGNYGMPVSMSPGTRLAVTAFWEYAAFLVNSIVFLLIGIEVTAVPALWTRAPEALFAAVAVLTGRAIVYPLSALANRLRGNAEPVSLAYQHVFWWGSLRGALSMALALGLPVDFPHRDTIIVATFGTVLFSLLAQGLTIEPLLRRLGLVERRTRSSEEQFLEGQILASRAALQELDRLQDDEFFPDWAVEALAQEYRARLTELAQAVAESSGKDAPLPNVARQGHQSAEARRRVLLTEKNALHEAERNGLLEQKVVMRLTERIDAQLLALKPEPGTH